MISASRYYSDFSDSKFAIEGSQIFIQLTFNEPVRRPDISFGPLELTGEEVTSPSEDAEGFSTSWAGVTFVSPCAAPPLGDLIANITFVNYVGLIATEQLTGVRFGAPPRVYSFASDRRRRSLLGGPWGERDFRRHLIEAGSCSGRCGSTLPGDCGCDRDCAASGDCCPDFDDCCESAEGGLYFQNKPFGCEALNPRN